VVVGPKLLEGREAGLPVLTAVGMAFADEGLWVGVSCRRNEGLGCPLDTLDRVAVREEGVAEPIESVEGRCGVVAGAADEILDSRAIAVETELDRGWVRPVEERLEPGLGVGEGVESATLRVDGCRIEALSRRRDPEVRASDRVGG